LIEDYACNIQGVWYYAPRSSYVWEKYSTKEVQEDYDWEYDDSDEKTFRISGSFCMPSDVYASIKINENGEIYGVNEYRLRDLINKSSGGYYNDDGKWYYIDDIWHYVWYWAIPCDKDDYEKYYRYSDREHNRIKTASGFLSINSRKIYGDRYKVIGSIPGGLEGYLDCYPIEVVGGPYIEKSESPIETVYADSRIYPIDGLHTDGYWYKLIKCPYIWNKYQVNSIYNWSVYNAVSSNDKYEAYLNAIDGTVTKLLDIIKVDYNNNTKAYCDDILDSKDITVVKNLRNAAYKLPYFNFNNYSKFYESIWITS
jgi:hypothetical protein